MAKRKTRQVSMRYLGQTAKSVRGKLGISQAEMATMLGISVVQLSKIENDHAMPSPKVIDRYAQVASVDIYVLDWCNRVLQSGLVGSVPRAALKLREAIVDSIATPKK